MNGKLLENYTPHKESSIDEAMIAFCGTLTCRQYMPAKPAQYGIKVWMRADSHNGYANEFEVYVGRPAGQKHEVCLGKKVILKLTEKLVGKNNHTYFDRFFDSVNAGISLTGYHPPRATKFFRQNPHPGTAFQCKTPAPGSKKRSKNPTPGHNLPSSNAKRSMKKEHNSIKAVSFQIFHNCPFDNFLFS